MSIYINKVYNEKLDEYEYGTCVFARSHVSAFEHDLYKDKGKQEQLDKLVARRLIDRLQYDLDVDLQEPPVIREDEVFYIPNKIAGLKDLAFQHLRDLAAIDDFTSSDYRFFKHLLDLCNTYITEEKLEARRKESKDMGYPLADVNKEE